MPNFCLGLGIAFLRDQDQDQFLLDSNKTNTKITFVLTRPRPRPIHARPRPAYARPRLIHARTNISHESISKIYYIIDGSSNFTILLWYLLKKNICSSTYSKDSVSLSLEYSVCQSLCIRVVKNEMSESYFVYIILNVLREMLYDSFRHLYLSGYLHCKRRIAKNSTIAPNPLIYLLYTWCAPW